MAKSAAEDLKGQLADKVAEWLKLEQERLAVMDAWNKKIKDVHKDVVSLSKAIQDGAGVQTSIEDVPAPSGEPGASPEAEAASKPPLDFPPKGKRGK